MFFYLNIEGWKVSAEQQLQAIELDFLKTGNSEKQVHATPTLNWLTISDIYFQIPDLKSFSRLYKTYPRVVTWIA